MDQHAQPLLMTVKEVCSTLRMSKATLYRRLQQRRLPEPLYVGDKMPRWRSEDIRDWVSSRPF